MSMADGYLEKRYDEVYGKDANHQGVRHGVPLDTLLIRNRSCRGYQTGYVVTEDQLKKIVRPVSMDSLQARVRRRDFTASL